MKINRKIHEWILRLLNFVFEIKGETQINRKTIKEN